MPSCAQCNRSYKTQSSLARHVHNHAIAGSRHTCPACAVTFSRRDLLNRHLHIHREPSSRGRRRRCHKACQPCREARVKCSGQLPCDTCTAADKACCYAPSSRRVSSASASASVAAAAAAAEMATLPFCSPPSQPVVDPRTSPSSLPGVSPPPPLEPLDNGSGSQYQWPESERDAALSANPATPGGSLFSYPAAWPWIHEHMFLHHGNLPDLALPDLGALGDSAGLDMFALPTPAPVSVPPRGLSPASAMSAQALAAAEELEFAGSRATPAAVVQELVDFAANRPTRRAPPASYWRAQARRVADAFGFQDDADVRLPCSAAHWLHYFVELYMEHFLELWPLISRRNFAPDGLHPILYLTLVSIGAMYGGARQRRFGAMLHEHTRALLASTVVDLQCLDEELAALGQARSLSQVAALYFGQPMGFSYAQHLGAILAGHSRRVELFTPCNYPQDPPGTPAAQRVERWSQAEARKRLALAILRGDVYTSVLLNTWPLIPVEEMELRFPCSRMTWDGNPSLSPETHLILIQEDEATRPQMAISDALRTVLDGQAVLSGLGTKEYEILLFGLQQFAWRQRYRATFPGRSKELLCPAQHGLDEPPPAPGRCDDGSPPVDNDHLGIKPSSLQGGMGQERLRVCRALQKWKQGFDACRSSKPSGADRTSIMSSILLYHLTYLRLLAPLDRFHRISYSLFDSNDPRPSIVEEVRAWAESYWADCALRHACKLICLLDQETQRPASGRARFNLLAFAGLHHAATTIWVYASTHEHPGSVRLPLRNGYVAVCQSHVQDILAFVATIYEHLSPAGWSSFVAASSKLSSCKFPRTRNG